MFLSGSRGRRGRRVGRGSHVEGVVPPEVAHLVLRALPQQSHPGLGHVEGLGLGQVLHPLDVGSEAVLEVLK